MYIQHRNVIYIDVLCNYCVSLVFPTTSNSGQLRLHIAQIFPSIMAYFPFASSIIADPFAKFHFHGASFAFPASFFLNSFPIFAPFLSTPFIESYPSNFCQSRCVQGVYGSHRELQSCSFFNFSLIAETVLQVGQRPSVYTLDYYLPDAKKRGCEGVESSTREDLKLTSVHFDKGSRRWVFKHVICALFAPGAMVIVVLAIPVGGALRWL